MLEAESEDTRTLQPVDLHKSPGSFKNEWIGGESYRETHGFHGKKKTWFPVGFPNRSGEGKQKSSGSTPDWMGLDLVFSQKNQPETDLFSEDNNWGHEGHGDFVRWPVRPRSCTIFRCMILQTTCKGKGKNKVSLD